MISIGTCSLCRGPVCVPSAWGATVPPTPRCQHCGATPENPHGPTIPMDPDSRKGTDVFDVVKATKENKALLERMCDKYPVLKKEIPKDSHP